MRGNVIQVLRWQDWAFVLRRSLPQEEAEGATARGGTRVSGRLFFGDFVTATKGASLPDAHYSKLPLFDKQSLSKDRGILSQVLLAAFQTNPESVQQSTGFSLSQYFKRLPNLLRFGWADTRFQLRHSGSPHRLCIICDGFLFLAIKHSKKSAITQSIRLLTLGIRLCAISLLIVNTRSNQNVCSDWPLVRVRQEFEVHPVFVRVITIRESDHDN